MQTTLSDLAKNYPQNAKRLYPVKYLANKINAFVQVLNQLTP